MKKTTEQFIEEACAVHNNFFDYSKVNYINNKTKVAIICPIHGEFMQSPVKHLAGQGCPKCVSSKRKSTFLQKYGVDNPMKNKEVQEKARKTVRAKYGVDYVVQAKEVRDKIIQTMLDRYGVDVITKSSEFKEKSRQSWKNKYGKNSDGYDAFQNRVRQTYEKKYGSSSRGLGIDAIRNKAEKTLMQKYGVKNARQNSDIAKKAGVTWSKKNGIGSDGYQDWLNKYMLTNQERFNCDFPMQNEGIRLKIHNAKKLNGTYKLSQQEQNIYNRLVEYFGEDDVLREYISNNYPFKCDFYIKSKDMYIEFNGIWTHGDHWFDENNADDIALLEVWHEKAKESDYYKKAIDVWTDRDIEKREVARQNDLNYIVFWDLGLRDVDLWFGLDCPCGKDFSCEYSWFML